MAHAAARGSTHWPGQAEHEPGTAGEGLLFPAGVLSTLNSPPPAGNGMEHDHAEEQGG